MTSAQPNGYRSRRRGGATEDDSVESFQAQAEQWSRRLGTSAQNIWWAGLGAMQRAQAEGSRLFDSLVQEGAEVDREGRQKAGEHVDDVRDEVRSRFEDARETAAAGWGRIERAFDDRLRAALHRLDVPDREEIDALRRQVSQLRNQVSRLSAAERVARGPVEPENDID
ncbi:phasin family protein [Stenotrophomonas sp. HITSZ_GD]|uniref:phasin family protein n=1 Tax=Stenotrophomonas sp. HITSZ_GD TaxID=3037248 RepID=UPI00240D6CE7|nr:phasin family protein [Stenotrophomonas sp. HITSZ_GD]MDG2526618.1 phasin family protein [Stenotrophomonas sp. HITSZ_GD]